MRIAWIAYGELAQPTGGYVYDRLVVAGLRARGEEVIVADPRASPRLDPGAFDVMVGDGLCMRELGPLFERGARHAARVLLVHHLASWEARRDGASAAPGAVRSTPEEARVMRATEARAIAESDRVVVTGRLTAARLALEYPGREIHVVVPGEDRLPRFRRMARRDRRIELLFVGSLMARKRVMLLLDAVEGLADSRLSVRLVGDPARDHGYADLLAIRTQRSAVLRGRVTFAGVLDDRTLARALAGADALVQPSGLEGYGMVLTEALHAGLPVIASEQAAGAAGIAAHRAVLVFDDRSGLRSVLERFAADASLRRTMRRAASRSRLQPWADTIHRFHEFLRGAVAKRAAGSRDGGRAR